MKVRPREPSAETAAITPVSLRGRLLGKYVLLFAGIVSVALIANGLIDIWFSYREQKALLIRIQGEQVNAAAARISQFVTDIEGQLAWTTHLSWVTTGIEQRRLEALRLLRQVPPISELTLLDASGREQLKVSRLARNVMGSQVDRSKDSAFIEAVANKIYHGPVYFRQGSEPYMTIALTGARREAGVSIAEINLKFIWDVVSQIKVGERGQAYVIDAQGQLIAHPDISLVLGNFDFSHLPQVRAARTTSAVALRDQEPMEGIQGERVLTAHAAIASLGWLVFVELPVAEAYASIYASLLRSTALIIAALALAIVAGVLLARRMIVPIQALQSSAERIGGGDLRHRIAIKTGDELEALGDQFNRMAAQLEESYATLERKVEERTHQLELADSAKSRFLAIANHDLRQPLHALGLFVAQLRNHLDSTERDRVIDRVDAALAAMNELFDALLDISKLDAGVLASSPAEFPVQKLFDRLETTFGSAARGKGLSLRMMPSNAWVRTDFILLERILLNLLSNAVRYTRKGGIVVGCRHRNAGLRIEIWDSGPGIPADQRKKVFAEFVRLEGSERDDQHGLGLGLAIVQRLCGLLAHPIELDSTVGKGSRFSLTVPLVRARSLRAEASEDNQATIDMFKGKGWLIVVVDDDALAVDGMTGLLRSWGCRVVTAASESAALVGLAPHGRPPDLIIADYSLSDGKTGIEAIAFLCRAFETKIPAFLVTGDTAPDRLRQVRASGYDLLHKPVSPMTLRTMLVQHLKHDQIASVA